MSQNGVILSGILDKQGIIVANGLSQKCTGVITRRRITVIGAEESAIDFVCLSSDTQQDLVSIQIDEERKHVLTSITRTKN